MNSSTVISEESSPSWLRLVLWAQAGLAVLAVGTAIVVGSRIKPLFETEQRLRDQIETDTQLLKIAQLNLDRYTKQLANAREAARFVTDGMNLYHERRYEDAVRSYDRALQLDPDNPYVLNLKGYSLLKARHVPEAAAALQKSVELDPTYAWGYFDLARAYCASLEYAQARSSARKALELRPDLRKTMRGDGEFMHLCAPIVSEVLGQ